MKKLRIRSRFLIRNRNLITGALVALLFCGILFYYNNYKIPKLISQQEILLKSKYSIKDIPKIKVPRAKKNLVKGAVLKEEDYEWISFPKYIYLGDEKFELIRKIEEIEGKYLKNNINKGDLLEGDNIYSISDVILNQDRLVEVELESIVANQLRQGQLIDLEIDFDDGEYAVVLSKKRIIGFQFPVESQNENQENFIKEKYKNPYITVYMDEIERKRYYEAKKLGTFVPRIYENEEQEASEVTFSSMNEDVEKEMEE